MAVNFEDLENLGPSETLGDELNARLKALKNGVNLAYQARGDYDGAVTYDALDVVKSGGAKYVSLQNENTGHDPSALGAWWEFFSGAQGEDGQDGDSGENGWSPQFAIVADGERRVARITGWTGGTGVAPASGGYLSGSGIVSSVAAASDIRGSIGATGAAPTIAVFGASGSGHSAGLVPDPGAAAGVTRFLREDGQFAVPPATGGSGGDLNDYLAKSGNLSGLADLLTARANLGLGGGATRNVGTTAGTVAAGDDARLSGAAQKNVANTFSAGQIIQGRITAGVSVASNDNRGPIGNSVGYFAGDGSTGGGDTVFLETSGNFGAFVARGGGEADLILQHMNAPANQQAFYYRVKNGVFDVIVLNDTLTGINRGCYAVRASDSAFSINFDSTFPAQHAVKGSDPARPVMRVQGAAGQSENLQEWRDSDGNLKFYVAADGSTPAPTSSTANSLDVSSDGASRLLFPSDLAPTLIFTGARSAAINVQIPAATTGSWIVHNATNQNLTFAGGVAGKYRLTLTPGEVRPFSARGADGVWYGAAYTLAPIAGDQTSGGGTVQGGTVQGGA